MSGAKCSKCHGNAWTWMGGQRPFECVICNFVYCHNCAKDSKMKCPRCGGELKGNPNLPK